MYYYNGRCVCYFINFLFKQRRKTKDEDGQDELHFHDLATFQSDLLVTGSDDGIVRIWDVRMSSKNAIVSSMSQHSDFVLAVTWSTDGAYVYSGGKDKDVNVWDIRMNNIQRSF